jgi:hypothetical protein
MLDTRCPIQVTPCRAQLHAPLNIGPEDFAKNMPRGLFSPHFPHFFLERERFFVTQFSLVG